MIASGVPPLYETYQKLFVVFVISGCSIYLIMNEIDPKLLPVPYIYSRPPIMEFVGNIKRADRPKGSTRKFYYIPEIGKWYKRSEFENYFKKNNISYIEWENFWIIRDNISSEEWINKVVNFRYRDRGVHTKDYIKSRLRDNPEYVPDFYIVKEDIIDQYYESRSRFYVDYDYSLVPEFIKSPREKFTLLFLDNLTYTTNYFSLIVDKNDTKYFQGKKAGIMEASTKEIFIEQAIKIHGNKYDYSEVIYINNRTPVKIYCNTHKIFFWQTPDVHLRGSGCPECAKESRIMSNRLYKSDKEFELAAISVHGNKYNYKESVYINSETKVKIFCNTCEKFFYQTPYLHINCGCGCPECANRNRGLLRRTSPEEWIAKFEEIHGTNFDYTESIFGSCDDLIKIRCKKHNIYFYQTPYQHLNSIFGGCDECKRENFVSANSISLEEFKIRIVNLYGKDRFDLNSIQNYKNLSEPISIYDNVLEETLYILPRNLLKRFRSVDHTCSIGANFVKDWLINNKIEFTKEYYVKDIKRSTFGVRIDFRICNFNSKEVWIEYNGEQHYNTKMEFYNYCEEDFLIQQERDKKVKLYCEENNIKLIEIPFILKTSEDISEFLNKVLLENIDPKYIINYKELYK